LIQTALDKVTDLTSTQKKKEQKAAQDKELVTYLDWLISQHETNLAHLTEQI
jgi:hypothetical protein